MAYLGSGSAIPKRSAAAISGEVGERRENKVISRVSRNPTFFPRLSRCLPTPRLQLRSRAARPLIVQPGQLPRETTCWEMPQPRHSAWLAPCASRAPGGRGRRATAGHARLALPGPGAAPAPLPALREREAGAWPQAWAPRPLHPNTAKPHRLCWPLGASLTLKTPKARWRIPR